MMNPIQASQLATTISDRANQLGFDIPAGQILKRLDQPSMLIGDTYRVVKEKLVPAAIYCAGQLYKWYMGENPVSQTAIEDRKVEVVAVEPKVQMITSQEQKEESEEQFFDPEWDGFLDTDYKDAVETLEPSGTSGQPKTEKTAEETVVSKKAEAVVKQKKAPKKNKAKVAFGSQIPRPVRRKKGMTDGEYINKFENNIRAVEDPAKPKKAGKTHSSRRLEELAKPKARGEDKYPSNYDIQMNFQKSLRK